MEVKEGSICGALTSEVSTVEDEREIAVNTLRSCRVPSIRKSATNAMSRGIDSVQSRRADALSLNCIIDVVGVALVTSVGSSVPPGRGSAVAISSSIDSREVGRADTSLLDWVIDLVGGACFTESGNFVEELRRNADALSLRGGLGSWRAADLVGASWGGSCRACTFEFCGVKDVSGRAALETLVMVLVEGKSMG